MLRLPEVIEFEKLMDLKSAQKIAYSSVNGFPIYDNNGVDASLSYGFFIPYSGGKELLYDRDVIMSILLMINNNSIGLNDTDGNPFVSEIKDLEFILDGEAFTISEPFQIQLKGTTSKSIAYQFVLSKNIFDLIVASNNRTLKVCGADACFDGEISSKGFRLYSLLFSKLADKWKEVLSKSSDYSYSIFPDSCLLNEELSGDKDWDNYVKLAQKENTLLSSSLYEEPAEITELKNAVADLKSAVLKLKGKTIPEVVHETTKIKTGNLIKESKILKEKYTRSFDTYALPRPDAPYKSGLVIAEINASKVIDMGFFNNPDLEKQFTPKIGGRTESGLLGDIQEAINDSYAQKKMLENIEKASQESVAKLVIFAVPEDPDHFMIDLVFFNKSKNREIKAPSLNIVPTYSSLEIKGVTHECRQYLNDYEDVLTVSLPFDYLYSINGKDALFVFDQEDDGDDAVHLNFKIQYKLIDLIIVDYLVRGQYWEQSLKESYEPLLLKRAELFSQSEQLDSIEKKDEETENQYIRVGCIAAVIITVIFGIIMEVSGDKSLVFIGVAIGILAIYRFYKAGKTQTADSKQNTANKKELLKQEIDALNRDFESTYANRTKK